MDEQARIQRLRGVLRSKRAADRYLRHTPPKVIEVGEDDLAAALTALERQSADIELLEKTLRAAIQASRRPGVAAKVLGRNGGTKGGPARAAALTQEQRSAIARKAATARWARQTGGDDGR